MKLFLIRASLILLLFPFSLFAQDKLIFAVDIIRHGDRTPSADIAYPPHSWPEGLGQLTATGMQQEFQNGVGFRQLYVTQEHLLPASYQTGTMYVRSSDYDRTLMSAESAMMGLYPLGPGPNASQPIPIHTEAQKNDPLFFSFEKQGLPLFQKYVFPSPAWQAENTKLESHYAYWSQVSGVKVDSLYDVIDLGDALYIRQLHHVALPQDLSSDDVHTIIAAFQWSIARLFYPQEVSGPLAHNLLMAIDDYFIDASHTKTHLKYVVYSAHDVTILSTLSALGAPLDNQVPYASDLKLELIENDAQQDFVVISLNGKPITIPTCASNQCPLSQFIKIDR
ncbi:MAG: histidine phosphatase family protein [Gammaproteobacteria bacterium]|nr:histidine phosphatase family protein [Gammaproteobacteria bacterium]